jgi:16S rRNA (adenine1518-N6/adenine1519-N6)-dimethyltransferase
MSGALVMVQREVADRIAAEPGGKQFGPLTVMIQAMMTTQRVMRLAPGCFWPQPKIESAVLRLKRRAAPLTDDPAALAELITKLFTRRRKQLGSIIGRDQPLPPGVQPTMRPEQLSVEQLCELADRLNHPGESRTL